MTLLEHYIKFSTREFQEPDRKGIEKGNAIGFYRGSHNAALYSLYNYEQKEIARLAGISYDFLRKQRTNSNFNGLAETLKEEFVEIYLYGYLIEGAFYKIDNATFSSLEEFDKTEMSPEVAFADIANYSLALKKYIVKNLIYVIGHLGIHNILDGADRILYLMSHWNEPELNKEIFKTVVQYGEEFICNTLSNDDSSEEMRTIAVHCTQFIAKLTTTL